MAISLRAKNSNLTAGAKYSYLSTNYASGVGVSTGLVVTNSNGLVAGDYILLGNFGNEISEIVQIDSVASATHTLTLKTNTKFAHPESTKVTVLKYNQVLFYQTALAVFDAAENPLPTGAAAAVAVQADSLYTILQDSDNTLGYGWFKFENATNSKKTGSSNAIPYLNFANKSVKKVLDSFYSLLNNKEQKLISNTDALNFLNEAYAIVVSELNLVNDNYNVPADEDFSIVASTAEYDLPDDFSKVISLYSGSKNVEIPYIKISDLADWNSVTSNEVRYSLRNDKLIITPTPTESITYSLKYKKESDIITSFYSNIDLPDHGEYLLINFMMSRSAIKLNSGKEGMFLELFQNDLQRLKISSHKRSNENDSWGLDPFSNI